MDGLMPIEDAARELGTTYDVLRVLARRGILTQHKRIGSRANLVQIDDARAALAQRRGPGRPARTEAAE